MIASTSWPQSALNFFHPTPLSFHSLEIHLMCVWIFIFDINHVEDQLEATIIIYWSSNQLNMFRANFAHPQERKSVFYGMWYNAPKVLSVGGLWSLHFILDEFSLHVWLYRIFLWLKARKSEQDWIIQNQKMLLKLQTPCICLKTVSLRPKF